GYLLVIAQQELDPELQAKGGASDLVQDAFLKAQRHFGQFRGNAEPELLGWLRRLLLNHLVDFRRSYQETAKRAAGREVSTAAGDAMRDPLLGLAAPGPSPSGLAMQREQAQAFQQALERLPEDSRQVLILRHQAGQSFEEIARAMNRSENAV